MERQDNGYESHDATPTREEVVHAYEILRERHRQAAAALEIARTPDLLTNYQAQDRFRTARQELTLARVLLQEFQDEHPELWQD